MVAQQERWLFSKLIEGWLDTTHDAFKAEDGTEMGHDYDEATTMVLSICFLFKRHLNIEIENASTYTPRRQG